MANLTSVLRDLQKRRSQVIIEVRRIDTAIGTLSSLNGRMGGRGKRKLSAAARARIAAAQKARWAKWRKSKKRA